MDVRLTLYGPLRGVTGSKTVTIEVGHADDADADGDAMSDPTVGDVVRAFAEAYPRSRGQLFDDEGSVRPSVRVLCDGEQRPLAEPVGASEAVALFPAMRGG